MKSDNRQRVKGEALLEIRGLRIEGNSDGVWHPIVKGVDLTLKRGEVLGLIGESGAGKSTIGLAAMGFARPGCRIVDGAIMFDGIDLRAAPEDAKRKLWGARIAYVAQSAAASFNPAHRLIDQTVETAVRDGLMTRDKAVADAIDLYGRLQLPNPRTIGERYPHQVSGGQLQRAMTAMAMSCRPDLIIFDEPTTALDVTTQVEVLAAMRNIVEEFHTAAIYITHDLAVVAQMADRIMVLRHGLEVEEAPTREMLREPREDYTKTLWAVRKLAKEESISDDVTLSVRNVDASYSGVVKVLDNVTVSLPRGRTVAVVGESGSGKSTLARAITGLLPPARGEILFNGKPLPRALKDRDKDTLRRIQMIYQSADTSLNPKQTVRDILGRPLEFYHAVKGAARDRKVAELLDSIELDESYIDRLPGELSGGQKQRISIARALAAGPDIIICDEVTSALDQIVQEEILTLLMKLQKDTNVSYLFITHDIATVRAISDEIVVMHRGKVVQQGPKTQVLNPPFPAYTELLLSSVPQMDPDWLTNLLAERARAKVKA
ncbi:ABC transporter ATP-binding protein [Aestuariivirga sp.]|uniref:ABC transporter ATP-binding protein n=1 Tax=Aestuariivirga sp. TaxID=2650926 RepID=UPI0025C17B2F|nr:ABC transporter ATP-binding protein [Aestuariivirga sp.]MCA3554006.1 ABC transporter ATP-binding protein [Aestuariivirga sp.]